MDLHAITSQEVLERISRHCPAALSVYLQCLNRQLDGKIAFTKRLVEIDMSENWRSFLGNVKKLARENLLEWYPVADGISVTLMESLDG